MAGGVAMVLPDGSPLTIAQILQQWTPDLLITQTSLLPLLDRLSIDLRVIVVDEIADEIAVDDSLKCRRAGESYAAWRDRQCVDRSPAAVLATDPFYICFTSGTTAAPKAVVRHHQSWQNSIAASRVEFGITAADRVLAVGSLIHSLFLYTAIEALSAGATLHLLPKFDPRQAIEQLQHTSVLVGVPVLLGAIVRNAAANFPTVRSIISGGAKLSASLHRQLEQKFPAADRFEYYGATELSFISVWSSRDRAPLHSVGRAFHSVEISIRREADGSEAATNEIGWVGVKSSLLSLGYLQSSDRAGFRIVQGWATVGDRGWLDEQGFLYLAGREQEMINSGGLKVYPAEVESVLEQFPEVAAAIVFGLPDRDVDSERGDRICAVLQWVGEAKLTRTALQARLRLHLARHKCPQRFFAIEQFPLTTSGKIARHTVQQQVLAGSALSTLR